MAHWQTKIPDSRFADARKCIFSFVSLFALHNKSYVNLANYLSACAAYTKYQQRSAFYYTRWFFRHYAVRLIQRTLNIINSRTQNTKGQQSHITNTKMMFRGQLSTVVSNVLFCTYQEFDLASNSNLSLVRQPAGNILLLCTGSWLQDALSLAKDEKWNLYSRFFVCIPETHDYL